MKNFAQTNNLPWMLAGDFNETRLMSERTGNREGLVRRCRNFNDWVDGMQLLELKFSGPEFTWSRGRTLETRTCARLDRAPCSTSWFERYGEAEVRHLLANNYDHTLLLISPYGFVNIPSINKLFRFLAAWLSHKNFHDFLEAHWRQNAPLTDALFTLSHDLMEWNKDIWQSVSKEETSLGSP